MRNGALHTYTVIGAATGMPTILIDGGMSLM
jgi:hypothetical protein